MNDDNSVRPAQTATYGGVIAALEQKYGPRSGWGDVLAKMPSASTPTPGLEQGGGNSDPDQCPACKGALFFRGETGLARRCSTCGGYGSIPAFREHQRRQAGIPERFWREFTFETWDVSRNPKMADAYAAARAWCNIDETISEVLPYRPFLLLGGNVGTGKTHLAVAAAKEVITKAYGDVRFYSVARMIEDLRDTQRPGAEQSLKTVRTEIERCGDLVLDDLGADRLTDFAAEQLYLIIDYRWQNALNTLITSNILPDDIDLRLRSRLLDKRLSRVVACGGPDQRLQAEGA